MEHPFPRKGVVIASLSRTVRRVVQLAAIALITGCVYFNGVYNAKEAAGRADYHLRQGDESGAGSFFRTSAESAESVLVRFPESKWRSRALFLAGRGAAYSGFCDRGIERLDEYLATLPADADKKEISRARLARASCVMRMGNVDGARRSIDSLIDVEDRETSRQARLWGARAALAQRDGAGAERYLEGMDVNTMAWEMLSAAVANRDYVRVESLLVRRTTEADYRDDAIGALRELLNGGQFGAADRVVSLYDGARVRDNARVAMHYLVGDYSLRDGFDSLAEKHLTVVRRLAGRDTIMEREASARLALLQIRRLETMRDIDSVFARQDSSVANTAFARRTAEQVLFVKLLSEDGDSVGARTFVAAEAARDSLRARPLARALFLRITREYPESPVAPGALYAASLLTPDSAAAWKERIISQHSSSNVAAWLSGQDPATRSDFVTSQSLLNGAWRDATRIWADTLRKIRAAQAAEARSRR